MSIIIPEQIQKDIEKLPEEAQYLLIDFIEILKKRYLPNLQEVTDRQTEKSESQKQDWSDFIGSIEAELDLSRNYKTYLSNELNEKYGNR